MIENLLNIPIGHLALSTTLILSAVATVIQISPIKIDPWSALARAIGRAINKEVIEKVDKLENSVESLNNKVDENGAKTARARILRFGDEIIHGVQHSKEHFDDILDDMTDYEHYCKEHPDFKNDKTGLTSALIKETYKDCLKKHNFI